MDNLQRKERGANVGEEIKKLMAERSMGQSTLALKSGVGQATISRILNGANCNYNTANALLKALGENEGGGGGLLGINYNKVIASHPDMKYILMYASDGKIEDMVRTMENIVSTHKKSGGLKGTPEMAVVEDVPAQK